MKKYNYQNTLIGKKQLRQLLAWSFTNYESMQSCHLADELKYLGFKYATQAGISISIEDLKVPFLKNLMLEKANSDILDMEKLYLKGKITDVERFQKLISTWNLTSESLKEQIITYFKKYDPLNSVYIMAFSGARGNLSQVRQLVGMRGLMSDPSGEIMNLPIKKNFREGLTITDYLMSGYGARKGIIDTALKTANSGYLTRRLIDVSQDIIIREKDCETTHTFFFSTNEEKEKNTNFDSAQLLGRTITKSLLLDFSSSSDIKPDSQITPTLIKNFPNLNNQILYVRSPLTCNLYRAICQKCYGWDLSHESLIDMGVAVGILAGQSIGEPGTQLTMRTFHTGGIFTANVGQQIISPSNGIIQFYKSLKTVILRTNRGEDVLVTKNAGSLVLIPEKKEEKLIKINVATNTILFPKNNQYVSKDTVLGELVDLQKQVRVEIKPILSKTAGEIYIPKLKRKVNTLNQNKLIWVLSGQFYDSPNSSFLNFYLDHKINSHSFIFRTKIINYASGNIRFLSPKLGLTKRSIIITNKYQSLFNTTFFNLDSSFSNYNAILKIKNSSYLIKTSNVQSKTFLQLTAAKQVGVLVSNAFKTLTGGTLYYSWKSLRKSIKVTKTLKYYRNPEREGLGPLLWETTREITIVPFRTLIWLGTETHEVNCEAKELLVENGHFISKNFELIPDKFSNTSGFVSITQKNNLVKTITIKSGIIYTGQDFETLDKKLYYPGEWLFSNIFVQNLVFCEQLSGKENKQLLIRTVFLYECPYQSVIKTERAPIEQPNSQLKYYLQETVLYKSKQSIQGSESIDLVCTNLKLRKNQSFQKKINIELKTEKKESIVHLYLIKQLDLNNYISPSLKYKHLSPCFLNQKNQFISRYTTVGYLESITKNTLEIVKFKAKIDETKKILLISNNECLTIDRSEVKNLKLNDFVINTNNINQIGKIIIKNKNLVTIQKGNPYFFPNCNVESFNKNVSLHYKFIADTLLNHNFERNKNISFSYYDITKFSIINNSYSKNLIPLKKSAKFELSRFFLKKDGKFYSSLSPQLFKKFTISDSSNNAKFSIPLLEFKSRFQKTLLLKNFSLLKNKFKNKKESTFELTFVNFIEQPFSKSTKSVGLYSITEDFFEQDVNSIFCKTGDFIESGKTLGLLNLEKEITGDIVQGLPRIEEILEARKKNLAIKRIATSKKKGLLVQKTSLDPNFEFKKVGMTILENDKINPHRLLKVYFNYYGMTKSFLCENKNLLKYARLLNNYEATYKSFKLIQTFILNSVQSIYNSQGVTINDRHLEIIIKQMTTKVVITAEGDTPLLRHEVVDLYHINHINKIITREKKQIAYYIPLLLGITKASLNNPSFISAASFQETTKVLTTAAIEGRIDWLRGLKENIITGHLIPAGTGSPNYRNSFTKLVKSQSIPLINN